MRQRGTMTIRISLDDINAIINNLPAFATIPEADRIAVRRVIAAAERASARSGYPSNLWLIPRAYLNGPGPKISDIKALRTLTGWGLKESKDAVESLAPFRIGPVMSKREADDVIENAKAICKHDGYGADLRLVVAKSEADAIRVARVSK